MLKKHSKPYAIDWDGTLVDHPPAIPFEEVLTYDAMPYAAKVITYLTKLGYEFYVLTARTKKEQKEVRKWLRTHGFPKMKVTNVKTDATLYIDDRAFRFTNWLDVGKMIR